MAGRCGCPIELSEGEEPGTLVARVRPAASGYGTECDLYVDGAARVQRGAPGEDGVPIALRAGGREVRLRVCWIDDEGRRRKSAGCSTLAWLRPAAEPVLEPDGPDRARLVLPVDGGWIGTRGTEALPAPRVACAVPAGPAAIISGRERVACESDGRGGLAARRLGELAGRVGRAALVDADGETRAIAIAAGGAEAPELRPFGPEDIADARIDDDGAFRARLEGACPLLVPELGVAASARIEGAASGLEVAVRGATLEAALPAGADEVLVAGRPVAARRAGPPAGSRAPVPADAPSATRAAQREALVAPQQRLGPGAEEEAYLERVEPRHLARAFAFSDAFVADWRRARHGGGEAVELAERVFRLPRGADRARVRGLVARVVSLDRLLELAERGVAGGGGPAAGALRDTIAAETSALRGALEGIKV